VFREKDPTLLPWKKLNVDWVIEASGHFTTKEKAALHLAAGAKKVLITAPAQDADVTIIPGVNDAAYNAQQHAIVSLGSCTTNCFAPIVKVLNEKFGIEWGLMSTVHAYTNDQMLLDGAHSDARRARAAGINIVPTKTGADRVITQIFPELEGKIRGIALRVPVPKVSILDLTFVATKDISAELINQAFTGYAAGQLKNILECATTPLVSSDFAGNQASAIIDTLLTQTVGNLGKVFGWYDNEVGYCARLRDFLLHK
jgi:glyceraldehyde 3-phosphate dehydrogenase